LQTFDLLSYRFQFTAKQTIHFPAGQPGNILRGAFGSVFRKIACRPDCPGFSGGSVRECDWRISCEYARIFEPASAGTGPSGLRDWPRQFVFRAAHLDGVRAAPEQNFWFDVNFFDTRNPPVKYFELAFEQLAKEGFGGGRGRAELLSVVQPVSPISIDLDDAPSDVRWLRVEFKTPTELKSAEGLVDRPEFGILFARARDRISTLRALYGPGPVDIDFRAIGERANTVRMTRCELGYVDTERRSTRTGQSHSIGGFIGVAEYEGELGEFLPYFDAACWTGVGRHCVWGNGELRVSLV
jgi:CRISPR-associated endoribonuclease Cas6